MSWLGERVTADLRQAVYSHVLRQSPQFFESTQTGEVLSRLTADTTLVQTVVARRCRWAAQCRDGHRRLGHAGVDQPHVMSVVLLAVLLVVLPAMWIGWRRVRRLSRDSQDRVADSSAIAAEVLNAIPVVQSYTAEQREEAARFATAAESAFSTAVQRTRARPCWWLSSSSPTPPCCCGACTAAQAVLAGEMTAGHLGQTVVYVMLLAGAVAVLGEVYGDLLRAAGATERLMELLASESPVAEPATPKPLPATGQGLAVEFASVQFRYPRGLTGPHWRISHSPWPRGDRGLGGCQWRRQDHRFPAAATLL